MDPSLAILLLAQLSTQAAAPVPLPKTTQCLPPVEVQSLLAKEEIKPIAAVLQSAGIGADRQHAFTRELEVEPSFDISADEPRDGVLLPEELAVIELLERGDDRSNAAAHIGSGGDAQEISIKRSR